MSTISKRKKIVITAVAAVLVIVLVVGLSVFGWLYAFDYRKDPVQKATSVTVDDDGKLRVLQLTDLHLTAPAWNGNDQQTIEWVKTAIRSMLVEEQSTKTCRCF